MKKTLLFAVLLTLGSSVSAQVSGRKFDRGFGKETSVFVPKGSMTVGSSVSYNHYSAGNGDIGYEVLSLITGLEGELSTVKISPSVFYFIANNTAIGARFGYNYTALDMDGASLSLDSDTGFDLSNHYFKEQGCSGSIALRNYISLFGSRVFGVFNEVRVGGKLTRGKSYQLDGDEKSGTYSDGYALNIGIMPGVTVFVTNGLSFEVALSVLECNYSYVKQTKNQVYTSSMSHFGTTFKPNLLGLSFAIMYYFQIGGKK